ncbi:hypothetical protein DE146DRAFT_633461 [Phaeosphaeria sp. MPI-PUGE-AT-0046c]|nr:hypothetical protein DE146DRAFT_633461 [Phaeosphaeria sp. MPI-PUGE-AT-0046c]
MLPGLSRGLASPWGQCFKKVFDQGSNATVTEVLTPTPASPQEHESLPSDTPSRPSRNAVVDFIPDFQPHNIPPLDEFTLLSQDCRQHSTQSLTTSDPAPSYTERPPAIPTTNYVLENELIHTLPLSIFTPSSPLSESEQERSDREPVQHEEWHAFNTTPTVSLAYLDRGHQGLPLSTESNPPRTNPQADVSHIHPARRRTYRPEDANNPDPPPPYYASEARRAHRVPRAVARPRHGRYHVVRDEPPNTAHAVRRVRHEGAKTMIKRIGRSLVSCFAGVGKTTRDIPRVARDMQQHYRVKRAKGKIAWLEKYDFMSAQDRLLTQDLRRDGGAGRC